MGMRSRSEALAGTCSQARTRGAPSLEVMRWGGFGAGDFAFHQMHDAAIAEAALAASRVQGRSPTRREGVGETLRGLGRGEAQGLAWPVAVSTTISISCVMFTC